MSIICDHSKCINCLTCIDACPFGAIIEGENGIEITDKCTMCNTCVDICPCAALSNNTNVKDISNLSDFSSIMVLVQVEHNSILDVSLELINKAISLSKQTNDKVYALLLGHSDLATKLSYLPIDKVINYKDNRYDKYNTNEHISALYDAISIYKPSILLIGATNEGRQLAPYVASKFSTGMTADCTDLQIKDGNLLQIRPAYGGKIMAEILTENSRPQIATVKNGVFEKASYTGNKCEVVTSDYFIKDNAFTSIEVIKKDTSYDLNKASIILCIGNGVKQKEDVKLFEKVANKLGATLCSTRALVEKGFMPPSKQIGLSGNFVNPKLFIAFGVSGSIQFLSGIKNCKNVISVNTDENANIQQRANYNINMDIYALAEELLKD